MVDFYWPEAELVVEADSYGFHRSRERFESDRRNDRFVRWPAAGRSAPPTAGSARIAPDCRKISNG